MKNLDIHFKGDSRLWNLCKDLVRRKWWPLVPALLFVLVAGSLTIFAAPQWEATVTVPIRVVAPSSEAEQVSGFGIQTAKRVRLNAFKAIVLESLRDFLDEASPAAELYRRSFRIRVLPNAGLMAITIRAHSPEDAKRFAEATAAELREIHREFAVRAAHRQRQKLAMSKGEGVQKMFVAAELRREAAQEVRVLETIALNSLPDPHVHRDPERGLQTAPFEKISVTEKPVTPKISLILILAGSLGLIFGVIVAFLVGSNRASEESA